MKGYLLFFTTTLISMLSASPQQPQVVSGEARVTHLDSKSIEIHTSDRAIINWNSFSISSDEAARFIMPSSTSAVLNRVTGASVSELMGLLEANGKVYLVNPSGLIIGKDAVINAAGFVASTLDVLNEDFLKHKELLFKGESAAAIVNYGTIKAWDGDILLLGRLIKSEGELSASGGVADLVIGEEILLRPSDAKHIYIVAKSLSSDKMLQKCSAEQVYHLQEELKTEGNPYAFAIKQAAHNDALITEQRQGRIYLVAQQKSTKVSKSLIAQNEKWMSGEFRLFGSRNSQIEHPIVSEENFSGILTSTGVRIPAFQNTYGNAISEALKDISTYDDFLYATSAFVLGYDRRNYRLECYPKEQLSSYDLINDQTYNMLRQKYRNYNTKYAKSL